MRKVLVNAQVTAMISTLESLCFVIHVAGVAIIGEKTTTTIFLIMVFYMVLFLLLLPYSFLMNTSHNKNRIVEHGWKNVIRNLTVNNSIYRSGKLRCCSAKTKNDVPETERNKSIAEEDHTVSKVEKDTSSKYEDERIEENDTRTIDFNPDLNESRSTLYETAFFNLGGMLSESSKLSPIDRNVNELGLSDLKNKNRIYTITTEEERDIETIYLDSSFRESCSTAFPEMIYKNASFDQDDRISPSSTPSSIKRNVNDHESSHLYHDNRNTTMTTKVEIHTT